MTSLNFASNLGIKSINKFSNQLYLGPISDLVRHVLKSALRGQQRQGRRQWCHEEHRRWQAAEGRNRGRAVSTFWGDCYDREGRRDEDTSVAEEVAAIAIAEQGAGAAKGVAVAVAAAEAVGKRRRGQRNSTRATTVEAAMTEGRKGRGGRGG
ncbi:hypothetical protein BHM03_00003760 [Ensete ventricosum]|nr:hypothetical protein BHM03_00003760 [Ensete ventricosum]